MKDDDIIDLAISRMKEAVEGDRDNREEALDDLQNVSGQQWPERIAKEREDNNRPVVTINWLAQFLRQVAGDIRAMNPAINIVPGDQHASAETADIIEGLVRQIQYESSASSIYERAGEMAAACGMGYFRIRTDYEDDTSFDQKILLEAVHNPFSVYVDPAARDSTRKDAAFMFISEYMDAEDFEEEYPGKSVVDVDVDGQTDGLEYWRDADRVMIAEYFWKEPVQVRLAKLPNGIVVENAPRAINAVEERTVETHRVMWAKISGKDVLEGPKEFPSRHIPVIGVMGEELPVGDSVVRTSVIRFAKDPQRLYNYWRSAQTELVALQPKAPYLVTPKQVAGFEDYWKEANDSNRPFLPFNPDEKAPIPQRAQPPVSSQGMMQEILAAADDMKATTGIYDAALGRRSNEKSGVAIRQRQMESDVSNSIYADNMGRAIQHAGEIIVDMIPRVYDTARSLRILGRDEAEQMVAVNGVMQTLDGAMPVNDLTIGKYAVKVQVGPNYATKRQEAVESMIDFVRAVPNAGAVTADLIAKNMDWPGADDFAERLKVLLPPGVGQPDDMAPEEMQRMQQEQAAQQQAQQMAQQMAQAGAAAEIRKAEAEATEAEADAQKAQFEALETQLELSLKSGQLNAAIQGAIARALHGAF